MFLIICQSTTDCKKHHTSSSTRDYSHRVQYLRQILHTWLSLVNVCIMESVHRNGCFIKGDSKIGGQCWFVIFCAFN